MDYVLLILAGAFIWVSAQIGGVINSRPGMGIANKNMHMYLTCMGGISTTAFLLFLILASGVVGGWWQAAVSLPCIIVGALLMRALRLPYSVVLVMATLVSPIVMISVLAYFLLY